MTRSLYIYTAKDLTLPQAIEACREILTSDDDRAVALLYAPQRCQLAQLDDAGKPFVIECSVRGKSHEVKRTNIGLESVFEARLFNKRAELRWLHASGGKGRAAVLSEESTLNFFGTLPEPEAVIGHIEQQYLLWGQGTGLQCQAGWSQMSTARIGAYMVPLANVAPKARVKFTAIEYLKTYGEYHNVGVADERLTGLELA